MTEADPVRYLDLADFLVLAEETLGNTADEILWVLKQDLADSALNAPRAGWGDDDLYPTLTDKAAILCARVAANHSLPDGNKRMAWACLVEFVQRNGGYTQDVDGGSAPEVAALLEDLIDHNMTEQQFRQEIVRWFYFLI